MTLERTYTIPLRREYQKTATYKRTKKATKAIKEFIIRHMKAADFNAVKILHELNLEMWKHGIRNPPHKVKVVAKKDDKGIVMVQLFGQKFPEAAKVEEKKSAVKKMAEKMTGKKEEHAGHDHAEHKHEEKAEPKKEAPKAKPEAAKPASKPVAPAQKHNQEQKR